MFCCQTRLIKAFTHFLQLEIVKIQNNNNQIFTNWMMQKDMSHKNTINEKNPSCDTFWDASELRDMASNNLQFFLTFFLYICFSLKHSISVVHLMCGGFFYCIFFPFTLNILACQKMSFGTFHLSACDCSSLSMWVGGGGLHHLHGGNFWYLIHYESLPNQEPPIDIYSFIYLFTNTTWAQNSVCRKYM